MAVPPMIVTVILKSAYDSFFCMTKSLISLECLLLCTTSSDVQSI